MAARSAIGATVRAVNKPRKFAARRAAITLVSLLGVTKLRICTRIVVKLCNDEFS